MARVKCEYCGSYISDIETNCPKCGAVNENHKRVVDPTPKTIEQLKEWYVARNLPSEEVTRFFIGKNIKEPRAFGIFEENGTFTVYKNKSDGSRAIRYKGTDEAYAVNELYLRLKEEILNQKKHNIENRRAIGNTPAPSVYRPKKKRSPFRFLIFLAIVLVAPTLLFNLILRLGFVDDFISPNYGYYVSTADEIFYCDGDNYDGYFEWWLYNSADDMWSINEKLEDGKALPARLGEDYELYQTSYDVTKAYNITSEKFPINESKEYIDAGHHENPWSAYYYYDDNLYYFLDDSHSSYGSTDNTGWYVFNTDLNVWDYYCDADDKQTMGDDLWYSDSSYYAGDSYDSIYNADEYLNTWNPTGFEDTSWYSSYESNESAYDNHVDDSNDSYDYDYDSDWDWDSGDSWDSGGTNWDSDW